MICRRLLNQIRFIRMSSTESTETQIPNVEIDPRGVFKYVLLKLSVKDQKTEDKILVRGYADCAYHSDIVDKVTESLNSQKSTLNIKDFKILPLGGGRISHDSNAKTIKVYGYSQGYGKADHAQAVDLLKGQFPGYNIISSDEGY